MAESCNGGDLEGNPLAEYGFTRHEFDMSPANTSDEALYNLQTFFPMERRDPKGIFTRTPEFLAYHAKTRIFSDIWLPNYAVWNLDPLTKSNKPLSMFSSHKSEPDNEIFQAFLGFLEKEFYHSDYRHAIYLSILGHIGNRQGEENQGVPRSLSTTLSLLINIFVSEVLPRIRLDETFVFIHPDHGTARAGVPWEEASKRGFLLFRQPDGKRIRPVPFTGKLPSTNWKGILGTLSDALGVDLPRRSGVSLLSYAS